MAKTNPVQRALAKFDNSPTRLAAAIGGGVVRQHVEHWAKRGRIPPEHCRIVQQLTGVPCWDSRPDDWWRIWPELVGQRGAPAVAAQPVPEKSA